MIFHICLLLLCLWTGESIGDAQNPHDVLISEVDTTDPNGYIYVELYSPKLEKIKLDGYSLMTASRSQTKEPDTLSVRHLIDLSGSEIPQGKNYGIITTHNNGRESLVKPFPSQKWKVYGKPDRNWLKVEDKKFLTIFLMYNPTKPVFNHANRSPNSKYLVVKDDIKEYLDENAVGYVTLS